MTAVGVFGLLLSLAALSFGFVQRTNRRLAIFALILIAHIGATMFYYYYSQVRSNDSYLYYADPYRFYGVRFELGTMSVLWVVQWLKSVAGGTYLDYFLLFHSIGFFGIVLVARTVEEISIQLNVEQPPLLYLLLFLPGMYFWTSAIGKDVPLFFACALVTWSMLDLRARSLAFAFGIALMFPIRPHIALIAVVALMGALMFDRRTGVGVRLVISVAALLALGQIAVTLRSTLEVDVSSASSIVDFVSSRQDSNSEIAVARSDNYANAAYPIRLFSLLYRPLFIDASGVFGLIASIQNLFMIFASYTLLRNWRIVAQLAKRTTFVRFVLFFAGLLLPLLALLYYNIGLGLRQREMATPALLALFVTVWLVAGIRRTQAAGVGTGSAKTTRGGFAPA